MGTHKTGVRLKEHVIDAAFFVNEWRAALKEHYMLPLPFETGGGSIMLYPFPGMSKEMPERVRRFIWKKERRI